MRTPPSYIEVILHCYYSPEPIPREEAPAVRTAIAEFLRAGMIEQVEPGPFGGKYQTTARGKAWVEMICATPYPEQVRRNPVTVDEVHVSLISLVAENDRLRAEADRWYEAHKADTGRLHDLLREADANLGTQGVRIAELTRELQLSREGFIQACTGDMPAMAQEIRELKASLDSVQGTAALRHIKLRKMGYDGPPIMSDKPHSEMMREANQPAAITTTTAQ